MATSPASAPDAAAAPAAGRRTPTSSPSFASTADGESPAPGSRLAPEVSALHAFLDRTGGPTGGWDTRDAALFRRVAASLGWPPPQDAPAAEVAKLRSRVVTDFMTALPGLYTGAEIEAHADWDSEHEALCAAKRDVLARWRAEKDAAAAAAAATTAAREEQRRKEGQQRAAQERAERAAQLEQWRAQSAIAAAAEEQRARESATKAAQEAKARHEKGQAELKARMAEVRKRKEEAAQAKAAADALAAEKERQRRREVVANAPAVRAAAEARVAAAEQARRTAAAQKDVSLKERAQRVAKAAASAAAAIQARVDDDPRRVLATTAAQRSREQGAADVARSPALGLDRLVRRGVPEWRKGLVQ